MRQVRMKVFWKVTVKKGARSLQAALLLEELSPSAASAEPWIRREVLLPLIESLGRHCPKR